MKLETERLILRDYKKSDEQDLIKNINNLKVSKWLLVVPYPYKKKDAVWWINKCLKNQKEKKRVSYNLVIEVKDNQKGIGCISLDKIDLFGEKAEVGYWLGEDYWRKGYGTEALEEILKFAFDKLKLKRVEADVFSENPSSGKLLELFGFKKEGYSRKAVRCKADGKIKDKVIYGLLKEEWVKR